MCSVWKIDPLVVDEPLLEGEQYGWKVRVWDEGGQVSEWSETQSVPKKAQYQGYEVTALLHPGENALGALPVDLYICRGELKEVFEHASQQDHDGDPMDAARQSAQHANRLPTTR